MAFERQRPIVKRNRDALKALRIAIEEALAALDQFDALGGAAAFAAYAADASWASDNGDVTAADVVLGMDTLGAIRTLWSTSNAIPVGPHRSNTAKAATP